MKKIQQFNVVWSMLICFILVWQFAIMKHVIFHFVWSPMEYIVPLMEDRLLSFVQGRVIFSVVVAVIMLLIEWVAFFVIGTKLWRRFKQEQATSTLQHYQAFWLSISLIVSGIMIVAIIGIGIRYGLTVQRLLGDVGMKSVTEILNEIEVLVKTTEFNQLLDVEVTFNQIVTVIKENSAIYKIAMETFRGYNISAIIHRLWHLVLVIGYGANALASLYQLHVFNQVDKREVAM